MVAPANEIVRAGTDSVPEFKDESLLDIDAHPLGDDLFGDLPVTQCPAPLIADGAAGLETDPLAHSINPSKQKKLSRGGRRGKNLNKPSPRDVLESTDELSEVAAMTHQAWNDIIKDAHFKQHSQEQQRRTTSHGSKHVPVGIDPLPESPDSDSAPRTPEGGAMSAVVGSSPKAQASSKEVRSSPDDPLIAGVKKPTRRGGQRYTNKNHASLSPTPSDSPAQAVDSVSCEQEALEVPSTGTPPPSCEDPSSQDDDRGDFGAWPLVDLLKAVSDDAAAGGFQPSPGTYPELRQTGYRGHQGRTSTRVGYSCGNRCNTGRALCPTATWHQALRWALGSRRRASTTARVGVAPRHRPSFSGVQ